jgi:hypothetical protein
MLEHYQENGENKGIRKGKPRKKNWNESILLVSVQKFNQNVNCIQFVRSDNV